MHITALISDDQGALELAHVLRINPEVSLQRNLNMHTRRHINKRPARPNRRIQGGELIITRRNDRAEILLEELRVLLQSSVRIHENDTLSLKIGVDRVINNL